ncbi:N-6 DNA methylase [Kitasatospora sp. NPDC057692]|uniref:type I restriction-modification system subunit M n=1 Tax=Kitasatospora sp. NPDC057692 TaxID=3346215 RepID=UPI0036B68BDB
MPASEEARRLLWTAADKLRGSMAVARYKEYLLGLVFLKYLSDAFDERRREIVEELAEEGLDADQRAGFLEDKDEYIGYHTCWVPETARWSAIAARTGSEEIGQFLDDAVGAVMRENPSLAGVLPRIYGQEDVGWRRIAELVALIGDERFTGRGAKPAREAMGEVYAGLLDGFSAAEGPRGGDFHTPASVGELLVGMLEPDQGLIYDPACGAGGLLVRAAGFATGGRAAGHTGLQVRGQDRGELAWRLATMNLAIHGTDGDLAPADSLGDDRFPGLKADFILSRPPFNLKNWAPDASDPRWRFGVPPQSNANFAWLQHIVAKLGDRATAGVVLAGTSVIGGQGGESGIRRALIESDLVACLVALPPNLFRSTSIPTFLWILDTDKSPRGTGALEDRRGQILFVDAAGMGTGAGRGGRVLTDDDIAEVVGTYRAWRGRASAGDRRYADVPGFCGSAGLAAVRDADHVLLPARYIAEAGVESTADRIGRLTEELYALFDRADELTGAVRAQLRRIDG